MTIKYRSIYLCVVLFFYISVCLFSKSNDAQTIANLEVDDVALGEPYAVMAYIYQLIPSSLLLFLTILIGIFFIFRVFYDAYKNYHLMILSFLVSIPCVLTIYAFQKDLILVLFTVPCAIIISSNKNNFIKLLCVSIIYLIYATIFRSYYYLITLIFVGIFLFRISDGYVRILVILAMASVVLFIPNNVYSMLQSSRDIVNQNRLGFDVAGNRTAFNNPMEPNSLFGFIYNYIYAVLRLNFSFFFNWGVQDLMFMAYPLIYFYYVIKGFVGGVDKNFLAGSLVLSHALVYFLFEPDTGSYARHLSSTLPYLAIIIASQFNKKTV